MTNYPPYGQPPSHKSGCILASIVFAAVVLFSIVFCSVTGYFTRPYYEMAADRMQYKTVQRQVSQIALALERYHDENDEYPPAYTVDASGKPMHSWRVLLLPYLASSDAQAIWERYDMDEPWDGPNNSKLADLMPRDYRVARDSTDPGRPDILAIVGPETMWPGAKSATRDTLTDDPSATIWLVEAVDVDFNWLEPRDLTVAEALRGINPDNGQPGIGSHFKRGALVLKADGTTDEVLPSDYTPVELKAHLTRAGDDDDDVLPAE